jgi:small subunit ribosomal protein S16
MLRFTLLRVGRKRTTDYRIVVRERRSGPRSQKYIESVGVYNTKTKKLAVKRERVQYWLSQGVQPSGTVHNIFVNEKIISGPKMAVTSRKRQQISGSLGPKGEVSAIQPSSMESEAPLPASESVPKESVAKVEQDASKE